jgi:hypothetical protein
MEAVRWLVFAAALDWPGWYRDGRPGRCPAAV